MTLVLFSQAKTAKTSTIQMKRARLTKVRRKTTAKEKHPKFLWSDVETENEKEKREEMGESIKR